MLPVTPETIAHLETLDMRLRWLSAWTIHNANHLRPSRDGVKVGGHQASCASMSSIMASLYFAALGPNDRVAVKPHAGPLLHAIHYLLGNQSLEKLQNFRGFGGAQSYPSRTKDVIPVDFSTGSVGLGVAITAFASLFQDYLVAHGRLSQADTGRMIALMGDAELDEGNIYEALIEAYKHDIRNLWWIVDYNRQSLDHTTADRMFRRFDDIFETCGWRVITLKHGRRLAAAVAGPGGAALDRWFDDCPNADYAALTYQGGAAWRARLTADLGAAIAPFLASHDDAALALLMTDLGGHCIASLLDAYARAASDDRPCLIIAYTVKGRGLPFEGALTAAFECSNCREMELHFSSARSAVVAKPVCGQCFAMSPASSEFLCSFMRRTLSSGTAAALILSLSTDCVKASAHVDRLVRSVNAAVRASGA